MHDVSKIIDFSNSLNAARLKVPGDTSWHKVELGANFNQGSFSGNWTGGGVSSVGIGTFFNALFENKVGKNAWRTDFQSQFGFLKNSGQQNRKNQDRIFFDTKYTREIDKKWTLFANINFQSQFSAGYDYDLIIDSVKVKKKVSGFLTPAYFTQSIGFEYKPDPYFFVNFAPGAFRQTIVWDKNVYPFTPDQKNYGVPINDRIRYELALMQVVANYNRDITKQMNLKFRYQLYSSILDPSNIDNRLDASLTAKVNKFINVNLSAIMAYDDDQSSRVQLAQGLNVGFLYSF
ncbi:DUF3078 domain-containing protein [Dyadobacter sp. CY312]|uniref:DUF3078 domain-containing protein n=1 Tax=Dyadobacter sp. CY312 TaxID=2907303 RepID=UPI001F48692E|nr:DUF3078 domain-containing protein [Dyadobacter sp. CY312]MCE7043221.1 DUF3078 domain-containing protein [Dyadobacter sp. CY312]